MKKEVTVQTILDAYHVLNAKTTKAGKMKDGEFSQLMKAIKTIKNVALPAQEAVTTANEKLTPENFEEIQEKAARFTSLTDAEKIEVNNQLIRVQNKIERCTAAETKKTVKIDISPLSEESFGRFVEANDFSVGQILVLQELLCK